MSRNLQYATICLIRPKGVSDMKEILFQKLKVYPAFIYKLAGKYYFAGRWLCKECTDLDATDCCEMFMMFGHREPNQDSALYFNKVRAYSDFALEVPCDPAGAEAAIKELLDTLGDSDIQSLAKQLEDYENCHQMYSGPLPKIR